MYPTYQHRELDRRMDAMLNHVEEHVTAELAKSEVIGAVADAVVARLQPQLDQILAALDMPEDDMTIGQAIEYCWTWMAAIHVLTENGYAVLEAHHE